MRSRIEDYCPACSFDLQVCKAVKELAKKHGLVVRGSVIPDPKCIYKIRFIASPRK